MKGLKPHHTFGQIMSQRTGQNSWRKNAKKPFAISPFSHNKLLYLFLTLEVWVKRFSASEALQCVWSMDIWHKFSNRIRRTLDTILNHSHILIFFRYTIFKMYWEVMCHTIMYFTNSQEFWLFLKLMFWEGTRCKIVICKSKTFQAEKRVSGLVCIHVSNLQTRWPLIRATRCWHSTSGEKKHTNNVGIFFTEIRGKLLNPSLEATLRYH